MSKEHIWSSLAKTHIRRSRWEKFRDRMRFMFSRKRLIRKGGTGLHNPSGGLFAG